MVKKTKLDISMLKKVVENNGGLIIDARAESCRSVSFLEELAEIAGNSASYVIIKNPKSCLDDKKIVAIAKKSCGHVIFDFCESA